MEIRVSKPDEKERIINFARAIKEIKSFPYSWESWHNWEKHPPVIALTNSLTFLDTPKLIGMWAYTYSPKRHYINTYYHAVDSSFRKQGVSSQMLEFILQHTDAERMKLKTHFDGNGEKFWRALGFLPFAKNDKEWIWDFDIRGCETIQQIKDWNRSPQYHYAIPEAEMKKYIKQKNFQLSGDYSNGLEVK